MNDVQWWCSAQDLPWTWGWRAYPGVWLFVLAIAGLYFGPQLRAGGGAGGDAPPLRRAAGIAGVLTVWLALDWPVGALGGGYLASLHMVQYILLALVAPPLLVSGLPPATRAAIERRPRLVRAIATLTHPVVAAILFVSTFLATHTPRVADGLMATQAGAFALDFLWIATGVLFWWPLVAVPPGRRPLAPLGRIGTLIAGAVPHTPIAMWLILASYPVYGTFELAPRVYGFDARADQQLAGGIMLLAGGLYVLVMLSVIFLRWQGTGDERHRGVARAGAR